MLTCTPITQSNSRRVKKEKHESLFFHGIYLRGHCTQVQLTHKECTALPRTESNDDITVIQFTRKECEFLFLCILGDDSSAKHNYRRKKFTIRSSLKTGFYVWFCFFCFVLFFVGGTYSLATRHYCARLRLLWPLNFGWIRPH